MDCKLWLYKFLSEIGHEVLTYVVRDEARKQGFTKAQLKAARKELGVITLNDNDGDGTGTGMWWWKLP